MSKQTFTQKDYDAFKSDPHLAGIFYDDLPDSDLLNKAWPAACWSSIGR